MQCQALFDTENRCPDFVSLKNYSIGNMFCKAHTNNHLKKNQKIEYSCTCCLTLVNEEDCISCSQFMSHVVCKDCFLNYYQVQNSLECMHNPSEECKGYYPLIHLENITPEHMHKKLREQFTEYILFHNTLRRIIHDKSIYICIYCYRYAQFIDTKKEKFMACEICEKKYCVLCNKNHEGKCHEYIEEDVPNLIKEIIENMKIYKCPHCLIPYIKEEENHIQGCNLLHCQTCRVMFCHSCNMKIYRRINYNDHYHFYESKCYLYNNGVFKEVWKKPFLKLILNICHANSNEFNEKFMTQLFENIDDNLKKLIKNNEYLTRKFTFSYRIKMFGFFNTLSQII